MFEVTEIRGSVEQGKVGPLASGVEDRFYAQGLEPIDIVSVNHALEALLLLFLCCLIQLGCAVNQYCRSQCHKEQPEQTT